MCLEDNLNIMISTPLVSWLIPAHRLNDLLITAIDSCITQDFTDHEILVLCNGPKRNAIAEFLRYRYLQNTFVKIFVIDSSGIVPSLNYGLSIANGKYIARLDSDDYSHTSRLSIQLQYMKLYPQTNLISTDYAITSSTISHEFDPKDVTLGRHITRKIYYSNPIVHPSVLMLKSDVLEVGGYPNLPFAEDYGLWVKLFASDRLNVLRLPAKLIKYNQVSSSNSRNNPQAYKSQMMAASFAFGGTKNPLWLLSALYFLSRYALASFH